MSPLWILKKKMSWVIFYRNGSIFVKQVLEKFLFLFLIGLKSMFIVNFATMNRYFLPVNIVNNVFCGAFLGFIWCNDKEFSFVDKVKCIPSDQSYTEKDFPVVLFLTPYKVFWTFFQVHGWSVLCQTKQSNEGFLLSPFPN